jgi:hypothetical protein
MNAFTSSPFDDIVWGRQHDAFDDRLGRRLVRAWCVGARDAEIAQLIHDKVHHLQVQDALGELLPFRKPRLYHGEVALGKDVDGRPILVPARWFGAGVLVVSNTGGGKSNLLCFLLLQLGVCRCCFWIVEMYKSQIRHLRRQFQRLGINLIILRPRDWKCNLLQASKCDPRLHLVMAVDILIRLLDAPPRARTILNHACYDLYRSFGIWEGRTNAWPCLFDLYEWVRTSQGLNVPARDAILDRLASLLMALTPHCAAYRLAWNPIDLARYSIVFEMRGASELVKQILIEPMLYSLFLNEVERGVVNHPMDLFVAFEDGQRFFDTAQHMISGEITPMDELAGVIRGSAKGLGVVVQTIQGLSRRLIPNLATKIIGRLGSHEDFNSLGADLALNPKQLEWVRLHLKPGMFVGQASEGDWREPFPFNVPLLNIPTVVDDREAAVSVAELDALQTVPADEFAKWEPHPTIDVSPSTTQLSEVEIRFLKVVIENPGSPSKFYCRLASLSGRRAVEIRKRLIAAGYLREHKVVTGARGRAAIILEPLEPAFEVAAGHGNGGAQ